MMPVKLKPAALRSRVKHSTTAPLRSHILYYVGKIIILSSVGVEPTNAACAPSTATSDVLNHYTIEASPKKDAQVAYITTPDAAVHSVYGFYINYFSVQNYDISLICSSDTCLFRPQWRHNPSVLCLGQDFWGTPVSPYLNFRGTFANSGGHTKSI